MKTNILFVLITFLLCSLTATSQVNWGPWYKKDGGWFSRYHVIGHDSKHYYINMRPNKNGGTLLKYDFNHKLVSTKSISLKNGKDFLVPSSFVKFNDKTFAVMRDYDKKKNKQQLFVSEFKQGKFGSVRKAYEQQYKVKMKFMFFGFTSYSDYDNSNDLVTSENKKYAVYTSTYSSLDKNNPDKMGIVVFDENMEQIWSKQQDFKYTDKNIRFNQVYISNKGEVFLTAKVFDKEKKKDKDALNYDHKVIKITKEGMEEYDVKLEGKNQVNEFGLFINEDSDVVNFGGFYSEYGKKKWVSGVFFGGVDTGSSSVNVKSHKFTEEFLEGLVTKKQLAKDKGLSFSYDINELITHSDGTFSFLAEKFYIRTTQTYTNGSWKTTTYYHSDEIVIPRFNKDGDLVNIEKIDKEYRGTNTSILNSYSFVPVNDKIYLIFNDAKKRSERKEIKKDGHSKGRVYTDFCTIDASGKISERETLFTSGDVDGFFTPLHTFNAGNKLMACAIKRMGKKYKFGKMELK